jgi:glyoxylase-like metal-dependent hydrolase (beta-lactamase superfamily II)
MPASFEQVHDRIYRLPCPFEGGGVVNLYLLRGAQTAIVDTGVLGTPTNDLTPALASLGLSLGDVQWVINTHGHMDHLGGNAELKEAGAEIALHREDLERATSNRAHVENSGRRLASLGLAELLPAREASLLRLLGREVGVDRILEDGDTVELGADLRLQVVHTPGHTRGSVCYWWEAAGVLITGDSVQIRGSRAGGMPVIEDAVGYAGSLKRVGEIGARTLLMAHSFKGANGDLGPVAREERVAEVLRESSAVDQALTEAVKAARAAAPAASDGDLARAAVASLKERLSFELDAYGLPNAGTTSLPSYLAATA